MRRWTFALALGLVCYGNGAAFIESFVNYPSWHLIGAGEFRAYHHFIGPRIIALQVAPALLGTLCTALLLWCPPPRVPRRAIWAALGLQLVIWVATLAVQLPIQRHFSAYGWSAPLGDRLMATNFWMRRLPYGACAVLFLWMAARLAARPPGRPSPAGRRGHAARSRSA
jgi:hypothetical protein